LDEINDVGVQVAIACVIWFLIFIFYLIVVSLATAITAVAHGGKPIILIIWFPREH